VISRFNYTDRIPLKAKMFNIVVREGPPRTFDIEWDLKDLPQPIPADTNVVVEAVASGSPMVLRFPFGTAFDPKPPSSGTDITELPGDTINFTVKLVDVTQEFGRLVGLCENIQSKSPGEDSECGKQSILPVAPIDLGQRVWRISYESNRPHLQVNKNVPDIMYIAQNDPRFFALVYPEVIRQVLVRSMIVEQHYEVTNDDDSWKDQWLRYAILWHPDQEMPPADLADPLDDDGREQLEVWIEEAVRGFCLKKGAASLLISAAEEEN
jgi:hypothetical protein